MGGIITRSVRPFWLANYGFAVPLDPIAAGFLQVVNRTAPSSPSGWTLSEVRAGFDAFMALAGPGPDHVDVVEYVIPTAFGGIPIRVYRPTDRLHDLLPATLWFHAGGFVLGSHAADEARCRMIADRAECVVINVDYRLAPEQRFPGAHDDAVAALRWVAANPDLLGIDDERIAVAGESAGANLAAATALWARDNPGPSLALQLLVCGMFDFAEAHPSRHRNGRGLFLSHETIEWFREAYVGAGADLRDHRISPLHAPTHRGLAPALVITAEFDPLVDEGRAYHDTLVASGVPSTYAEFDGQIHMFFGHESVFPAGRDAMNLACEALRSALAD